MMMMMRKQRDSDGEPLERDDGTYVFMRADDHSFWMKTAWFMDKYRILWIPLVTLLAALGFGFQTPAKTTRRLQVQIDEIRRDHIVVRARSDSLGHKIDILLRLRCIDKTTTEQERLLVGLDCTHLISQLSTGGPLP